MKKYIWINLISIFGFVVIFENSCIAQEVAEVPNQELSLGLSLGYGRGFQYKFDMDVCNNNWVGLGITLKSIGIKNAPANYGGLFEPKDRITSASFGWIFSLPLTENTKMKIKCAPSFNFYAFNRFSYKPQIFGPDYTHEVVSSSGFGINYEVEILFKTLRSVGLAFGFNGNINNTQSYAAIQIIGMRAGNFSKFK